MQSTFKVLSTLLVIGALSLSAAASAKQAKVVDWDTKLKPAYDWIERSDPDKAIVLFNGFIAKYPAAAPPHMGLGMALKHKGKTGEAKAEFQKTTQVDPGFAEAYYELGAIQQIDKEYAAAVENFERYLQLAPTSSKKNSVADRIVVCRENLN